MTTGEWYYAEDDQQQGPFGEGEIRRLISHGVIERTTLVWREGLEGWEQAKQHFAFAVPALASATRQVRMPPPPSQSDAGPSRSARYERYQEASRAAPPTPSATGPDGLYIHAPARGFGEAISVCLGKYASFSGRASRSEFWFFILFGILISFAAGIVDVAAFGTGADDFGPFSAIASLGLFIPTLAVTFRRLHDTGRSGWWVGAITPALLAYGVGIGISLEGGATELGGLIAIVGGLGFLVWFILLLVWYCTRGDAEPNRFG